MPVPASVATLLNNQNIHYDVTATPAGPREQLSWLEQHLRKLGAAKSVLLEDERGRVQVVIAADTLLDLAAVNRQLERELRVATPDEMKVFYDAHSLQRMPALPKVAGLPTLVDRRLLDREDLLLDSGDAEQLLHLSRSDFQRVLEDALICDISTPLAPLEVEPDQAEDEDMILGALRNFTTLRIKQRLEETLELPPLSDTAQRIIQLRANPDADISDLAQIVETDPSLAAQVVSWAASPYYSAPGKIRSVQDAIVRVLGFDMVLNLALGLALGKTLSIPRKGPHGVLPYWQQAVYLAATIEGLVTAIPRDSRPGFGMAYLAGLLHNFGYLILAEVFPPYYAQYCQLADANPHTHHRAIERHLLGVTREQLAGALMSLWSMPDEVVVALRQQHNLGYRGEHWEYARLIYIAERLLQEHGIGRDPLEDIPARVFQELQLDPEKARAAVAGVLESSEELNHIAFQLNPV